MAEITEVLSYISSFAPIESAEPWDNVGLLVNAKRAGDILVALDITDDVINEAIRLNCAIIVSHHPVIFGTLKAINCGEPVYKLIQNDISALCMHTNLDAAEGGVNDALCAKLCLSSVKPLEPFGRIGALPRAYSAKELSEYCAQKLCAHVKFADAGNEIRVLAVVGGSGKEFIADAINAHADAFLTGEAGHHDAIYAKEQGISLLAAGHFATEQPMMTVLAQRLRLEFDHTRVYESESCRAPFEYI
ncbi:MAG: Nif3-like dinuclear metal center hexameric protein [Oscillospiraceae bacterium]